MWIFKDYFSASKFRGIYQPFVKCCYGMNESYYLETCLGILLNCISGFQLAYERVRNIEILILGTTVFCVTL